MTAREIVDRYVSFFEKREHKRIANAPLVPLNDPTTLFISSGMQPLVPYLLGATHPQGKRLVNVQNCFRAVDIDEVGDNRHTTFFRMLGNWSFGDYFKKEEVPWLFDFLVNDLILPLEKLYITVFEGYGKIPKDNEALEIWKELFQKAGVDPDGRIIFYGTDKNWWSRSGPPEKMPTGEPGGPSTEVFYDFETDHDPKFGEKCHLNCDCGRYVEIANSVFMQYKKEADGMLKPLPKPNVDFGGGLERLLQAIEHQPDVFKTSLLSPIIRSIEKETSKKYTGNEKAMRIVTDHLVAASFINANNIQPSNKDQGYVLRRLIRRSFDNFSQLGGQDVSRVIESIISQYKETDPGLVGKYENIKFAVLEEINKYKSALDKSRSYISKKYKSQGDELKGVSEISAEDAFFLYTSHGLSPTQIESLGYTIDDLAFANKMEEHHRLSRKGAEKKFRGGLADHQEKTIMGHTATHLLHQALRDVLGDTVHQTGSNITTERVRFDFSYDKRLADEEIRKVQDIVNEKIKENLPIHFELIPTEKAHTMGAIGLFMDTYGDKSKIYFIGPGRAERVEGQSRTDKPYSIEFCGGPHVDFTGRLKSFKIIKQENLGKNQKRIYAVVG